MTLAKFVNMTHTDNGNLTVYVFDNEDYRDEYRQSGNDGLYLFTISSPYVLDYVLHERFAQAEVKACCPHSSNVIDVIIELEE